MSAATGRPAGPDPDADLLDAGLASRLRDPGYQEWRTQVQATRGCAAPIHLRGSSRVLDRDGATLIERTGTVLAPCGNRREAVCPACSDRYCADAFHLLRAGLAGDDTKGVPVTVVEHARAFVTLTAPSFGRVHTRTVTARGHVRPCGCGERHRPDDPRVGTALDAESYDYVGAVLWQAHAGALWARFATHLRRALAAALGVGARDWPPTGGCRSPRSPSTSAADWSTSTPLCASTAPTDPATHRRPGSTTTPCARRCGTPPARLCCTPPGPTANRSTCAGGRSSTSGPSPRPPAQLEDEAGEMTDATLAAYIAKYATKGTGAHEGADRPIRDIAHVEHLRLPDHHRRMITTAWQLGGRPDYAGLQLRRWAHMLGFRGHFLTKSRRYSTTFGASAPNGEPTSSGPASTP